MCRKLAHGFNQRFHQVRFILSFENIILNGCNMGQIIDANCSRLEIRILQNALNSLYQTPEIRRHHVKRSIIECANGVISTDVGAYA